MYQKPIEQKRPLLILDLDETLVHASMEPLTNSPDLVLGTYHVYTRPYLQEFLNECADIFDVAIWSSGEQSYVNGLVRAILPDALIPAFIWSRERCSERTDFESNEYYFEKNLKKVARLGYKLEQVLIVDDDQRTARKNYGNAICIAPFEGDPQDMELKLLLKFLRKANHQTNFRLIDKGKWNFGTRRKSAKHR